MTKITLLLLTLLSFQVANAQESATSLVVEGRLWNMVSLHPAEMPEPGTEQDYYKDLKGRWCKGYPFQLVLEGDTMMTGKTYKKMMRIQADEKRFICGLRQDGDCVYGCYQNGGSEELFFDFGLNEGDIFLDSNDDFDKMLVNQADKIVVNGIECRRLFMWFYEEGAEIIDGFVNIWIEGVGGVIGGPAFPFQWAVIGNQTMVLSCYQENELLYSAEDHNVPPVTESIADNKLFLNSSSQIFDLQGRRLKAVPEKGVYIRGGRKIVSK